MQYMGEIFRDLRKGRNISLKEATDDEFSPSMLSRFENGESDISATKLMYALDNIRTEFSEFVYLIRGFQPTPYSQLKKKLWDAQDRQDIDLLHTLYEKERTIYKETKRDINQLNALLIKSHLFIFDKEIKLDKEEEEFLYNYLFSVAIWGEYELKLFSDLSILLPLELYFRYSREMLQKVDFLKGLETNRKAIQTILLNGLFKAIESGHVSKANYFNKQIEDDYFAENEAYFRIVYLYALGLLDCLKGNVLSGEKKLKDAISVLRVLGCDQAATYYEDFRRQWLKKFE